MEPWKKHKGGMLWVDQVGDRRSKAILAQIFQGENGNKAQNTRKGAKIKKLTRVCGRSETRRTPETKQ
jgi:hypothetical protein